MISKCPYCHSTTKTLYICSDWFRCKNHNNIIVEWCSIDNNIICTHLYNKTHWLNILHTENIMYFFKRNGESETVYIPFDKNITPKNFEEKLKTYLIFQ